VAGNPHYCLLGRARLAKFEGAEKAAAGTRTGEEAPPLPASLEEFLELVQRAFGPEPHSEPQGGNTAAGAEAISFFSAAFTLLG